MALIDSAIDVFLIAVPVWFLVSFVLFVIREEGYKSASEESAAVAAGCPEVPEPVKAVAAESGEEAFPIEWSDLSDLLPSDPLCGIPKDREVGLDLVKDQGAILCDRAEQTESVPSLPMLKRGQLTVWSRRKEQVVPVEGIGCAIPESIQRLRWRNADVIRLMDLEAVAAIV